MHKSVRADAFEEEGVSVVIMREGKCPVCGAQIERGEMDKWFPYCGYKHWREKDRAREAAFRRKVYCQNETDRKRSERRQIERAKREAKEE